jgi:WD40 repeat protein/serine/threonine protein kinase
MSDQTTLTERDDIELAELVAEIGERLRRGEKVLPEDYPHNARTLRELLPTIKLMADLPTAASVYPELGHLDDFRLIREVSHGGMGVVYEAIQVSLGRRVALKVLPNAKALDPRHLQRFHLEAQAAASLNHPHIVPVFATGSAEGMPYYAMRFIDGRDLARVIRELRRDEVVETEADARQPGEPTLLSTVEASHAREVARIAKQAAEALEHAHASDVVHRDIKPSNLMIDNSGELWITDFGLARVRGGQELTQTGDALGTPRYMSPEQALGRRTPLDGRTDIYSLGATIYELLTLHPAVLGDDRLEVMRQIAQDEPRPPRQLDPTIPVDLETIVLKAMAKAPADRYATAADLAADLGRFLDNRPILARRPSLADRGAKWMRRHRVLVVTATAGLMIFVMGLAGAVLQYDSWLRRHNDELEAAVALANKHALDADRHRRLADRHNYAATLRLAGQAIGARQFESAQNLLESVECGPEAEDPRDFAWHYLWRLSRRELVRLPERDFLIHGISLTRDGRTLAALYEDSKIVLWDLPSEQPRLTISAAPDGIWDPCLTSDGRILVSKRWTVEEPVRPDLAVWDATTGKLRRRLTAGQIHQRMKSESVQFLDGERFVAYLGVDEAGRAALRVWDLVLEPPRDTPRLSLDGVDSVAMAPGGPLLAAREGSRLTLREISSGAIRLEIPGDFLKLQALTLSPDGRLLATAVAGQPIVVWEVGSGIELEQHEMHSPAMILAIDPRGRTLAAADEAGLVHLWNRSSGREKVLAPDDLDRRRESVRLFFSADGTRLATTSYGNPGGHQPVAVWDVASGRRLGVLPSPDQNSSKLIFSPDGRSLIDNGGASPRIWHFDPPSDPALPEGHADEAWAAAYSPDGKILATGSDDTDESRTIKLWDPDTGRLLRGWSGGEGTVAALAFSPDGRSLASGHISFQNNVRLWDVSTGNLLGTFSGHTKGIRTIAVSPDGHILATAGKSPTIRLWDTATRRCLRLLDGHTDQVRRIAFSPDGTKLATASLDETVRLWDVETGRALRTERSREDFHALAFSHDGATLAAADEAGVVTIRDATSLSILKTLRGEHDELLDLVYAPDGRSLATSGISGTIRIWDTLTGQELLTLLGHKTQVNGIAFAPDGSSLASCSHDGAVKLWRAGSERSAHPREP